MRPWTYCTGRIGAEKVLVNTAIFIVLISFLFMESGCSYYKVTTRANSDPKTIINIMMDEFYPESKYPREIYQETTLRKELFLSREVFVIDRTGRWRLELPEVKGDSIFARASSSPLPHAKDPGYPEYRRSRQYKASSERYIIQRVILYIDSLQFVSGDTSVIPVASIHKYDIYEKDGGKSSGVTLLIVGGIALTASMIISIAVATKRAADDVSSSVDNSSSCPFIYAFDGKEWQFTGEIFGGATLSTLERNDYLVLPGFNSAPGSKYGIIMANFLPEIQYINQADLILLSHDSAVGAFIDKYGNIQTVSEPVLPSSAFDSRGKDCLGKVQSEDSLAYMFDEDLDTGITGKYLNSIEMTFHSISKPKNGKIIINAKNSYWGDYIVSGVYRMFGDKYQHWVRKQEKQPGADYLAWMQQQGIPLQVYIMKDNKWQMADYFDMTGAFINREMVLPLDLADAWTSDEMDPGLHSLRIKLATGYKFWELDFAALDLGDNAEVESIWVLPEHMIDQDGKDPARLLENDDMLYLVQDKAGDHTLMEFTLPQGAGSKSTLYFHSKGYYHQDRESSGEPEITLLRTFLEPGQLSRWSYRQSLLIKK